MSRKDYISDNLINLGSRLHNPSAPGVMSGPGVANAPANAAPNVQGQPPAASAASAATPSAMSAFEQRAQDIRRSRQDLAMRMNCELAAVEKQLAAADELAAHAGFIRKKLGELEELEDDGSQSYFMKLERLRIEYFVELTRIGRIENASGNAAASSPASSLSDLLRFAPRDRFRLVCQLSLPVAAAVILGAVIVAAAVIIAF